MKKITAELIKNEMDKHEGADRTEQEYWIGLLEAEYQAGNAFPEYALKLKWHFVNTVN